MYNYTKNKLNIIKTIKKITSLSKKINYSSGNCVFNRFNIFFDVFSAFSISY